MSMKTKILSFAACVLILAGVLASGLLVRAAVRPYVNRAAAASLAEAMIAGAGFPSAELREFCDDGGGRYRAIYFDGGKRLDVYIENDAARLVEIKLP
jgi:hypothetical protein